MLIDHTEPRWAERYNSRGTENGAATYSREIIKYHVPQWLKLYPNATISTCPMIHEVENHPNKGLLIQYLHEYPYNSPIFKVQKVLDQTKYDRVIFVTAYKSYHELMKSKGIESVFIPMAIEKPDVEVKKTMADNRVIYFGNVTSLKAREFQKLRMTLSRGGLALDVISKGMTQHKEKLTQREAWEKVAQYTYAIGVGRCYQEAAALGCKVIIDGANFGGITITDEHHKQQLDTNYNGRIVTFDRDLITCLSVRDQINSQWNDITKLKIKDYLQ